MSKGRRALRNILIALGVLLFAGFNYIEFRLMGVTPCGILHLQMAFSVDNGAALIGAWIQAGVLDWVYASLILDYFFMTAYTLLLLVLAWDYPKPFVRVMIVAAGLCDVCENTLHLTTLSTANYGLITAASVLAGVKFLLIFASVVLLVLHAVTSKRKGATP